MRSRIPSYNVSVHCMEDFYMEEKKEVTHSLHLEQRAWIDHRGH